MLSDSKQDGRMQFIDVINRFPIEHHHELRINEHIHGTNRLECKAWKRKNIKYNATEYTQYSIANTEHWTLLSDSSWRRLDRSTWILKIKMNEKPERNVCMYNLFYIKFFFYLNINRHNVKYALKYGLLWTETSLKCYVFSFLHSFR